MTILAKMSAWFILSVMGFYVVEVDMGAGKILTIRAEGNGPDRTYIQSVRWNGRAYDNNWIAHYDLSNGGVLVFSMGSRPSRFASRQEHSPPSFGSLLM